ncbi:unnamed protein product [Owenia fusiformis]|uniref:Transporter n=1 Tax=Owenia fusiformis TaxID=6347 RepID=A0A8J1UCX1_OWEFU|nr:unnamed protein product [Owenia fusiformis]
MPVPTFLKKFGILERCGIGSSEKPAVKEKKEKEPAGRAQWSSQTEFLLTCIGYSVGLGNVWRFPYLCYKNGGGAFLLPYMLMMVVIGFPLLFMEYSFGQYFGVGSLTIYKKVCPLFKGVGISYCVINAFVCIYYNVIIALSLYYLFGSFTSLMPWTHCNNAWNTEMCLDAHGMSKVVQDLIGINNTSNSTVEGTTTTIQTLVDVNGIGSSYNISGDYNMTSLNMTSALSLNKSARTSPTEEYWKYKLLNVNETIHGIDNIGNVRWHVCLCLLLAWILVVLIVCKGIKSSGKVVYFTATFPYLMLTVLVVRGVTLEGATDGILYFVTPVWSKLASPEVWFAAATQLFYATNIAWGGMLTMASYNTFHHNCFRDAIIINLVSFFTSLYAGFAVFSVIGYMAHENGQAVEDVIKSGPGLAFIVYPEALGLMPLAPMWSALFFFMLFLLGIGSQMVGFETVITGLCDEFPIFRKRRLLTSIAVATLLFLFGIPCVTQGGMYVLQLMDWYAAGFCVLVVAVCECLIINWFYGNEKFAGNIKEMLGDKPGWWWRICWKVISPVVIVAILIFSFVKYSGAKYGEYIYPGWADGIGWCMGLASIVPIGVVALYTLLTADAPTLKEKYILVTTPDKSIFENRDKASDNGSEDSEQLSPNSPELKQTPTTGDSMLMDDSIAVQEKLINKTNSTKHFDDIDDAKV